MKPIKIDLSEPFPKILARVRSLPATANARHSEAHASEDRRADTHRRSGVEEVLRAIYEAANGRQVATQIGLIPIAPPIAAFLKDAPFYVQTQSDFLLEALARLCSSRCSSNARVIFPRRYRRRGPGNESLFLPAQHASCVFAVRSLLSRTIV